MWIFSCVVKCTQKRKVKMSESPKNSKQKFHQNITTVGNNLTEKVRHAHHHHSNKYCHSEHHCWPS